jgi:hypothetical protein
VNKKQRLVLAIFVPVIIFFLTLTIAYYIGVTLVSHSGSLIHFSWEDSEDSSEGFYTTKTYNPFNWQKTWYVWMFCIIFCCIFEYKLFADKKRKIIKGIQNEKDKS